MTQGQQGEAAAVPTRIQAVAFHDRDGTHELRLQHGRIAAIEPSAGQAQWLALPPLANLHVHANRAFSADAARPRSLAEAIGAARRDAEVATVCEYRARARTLFARALSHGTTTVRSHTDVGAAVGMRAVSGVIEAAKDFADVMDVEVVAFAAAASDPAHPRTVDALTDAVVAGATLLGAVPAMYESPRESMHALAALARRLGVGLDLHLDEHMEPEASLIDVALDAIECHGLQGRAVFSHVCALSSMEASRALHTLDRMAQMRVALVALPELNLYLQDRGTAWPRRRGVAPIAAALRAGVEVRLGTDNVRDWFFPWGDADLFESAYLAGLTSHVDSAADLVTLMCNAAESLRVGARADLVLIPATSLDDALARRPAGRTVLRRGRCVVGSLPDCGASA